MGWKFEACRCAFSQNPPFQGTGKPMLSQAMEDRDISDKMTGKVFGTSFALILCKSMLLIQDNDHDHTNDVTTPGVVG